MIRIMVVATLVGFYLFSSVMVGIFTQPWAGWWFPAPGTGVHPGQVPPSAVAQPAGPLRAENTDLPLMAAIAPWMGTPYLFGGATLRGVDCSNFVMLTGRALGVSLPAPAETQWGITQRIPETEASFGDLVFFKGTYCLPGNCPTITHVGWYLGEGWMISAAEPFVGRQSIASGYWRQKLAGFGRIRRA